MLDAVTAPLLLVALWLPGCNQGGWRVDTPLYTAVSRWMFEKGTWEALVFPMVGDQAYFNKPPLAFWIHGLIGLALPNELWAARLPTLLSGVLALEATRRAFKELGGRRLGLASACVLALTVEFFRYTRAFSLDLWVVLFLMLSLWSAARALRTGRGAHLLWGGAALGACLMVKPLFALAFPAVYAAWLLWCGRVRLAAWCVPMLAVAAAFAAPWHVAMVLRWGDRFVDEYFGRQTVGRALGEAFAPRPWWFVPWEVAQFYWPWMLTLGAGVWCWARTRRLTRSIELDRVALIWTLGLTATLVAFKSALVRYAVPLYPVLSVVSAAWLTRHAPRGARRAVTRVLWLAGPAAVVISAALAVTPIRFQRPPSEEMPRLYAMLRDRGDPPLWCMPGAAIGSSTIYLQTGTWPALVKVAPDRPGGVPRSGDIVLYPERTINTTTPPRAGDERIGKFSGFFAVRLTSDWAVPEAAGPEAPTPDPPASPDQ